ncbi:MarR family winged helix-turn-helix transcriptional regulator [Streptomyces sp. NPDC003247]|uniref:MarR family winged helix-turn-helix transcriptional regulator n=1 Tax=Streptomyces sp. NPDC003247 TaxID=3364677 RepID=UPI003693C954
MTVTAPPADSRAVALAHYAARAVLERALARHGTTFPQQIALSYAVAAENPLTANALVDQVTRSLKSDPAEVLVTIGELRERGLLSADGPLVRPTEAGRELIATVTAETSEATARIWAGIPAEDLAAAGRVLAQVAERADAELAAPAPR